MSKPSEWLPKTNKLFERWCFASPTPREILESFNKLETELADKDRQLAEARAEIERLKGVVISQITPEPVVLSSYSTSTEPAKDERDKLIEQMREAIKFSLIADEIRQTRNICASDINDACETSKVKRIAALSAAERGERL